MNVNDTYKNAGEARYLENVISELEASPERTVPQLSNERESYKKMCY